MYIIAIISIIINNNISNIPTPPVDWFAIIPIGTKASAAEYLKKKAGVFSCFRIEGWPFRSKKYASRKTRCDEYKKTEITPRKTKYIIANNARIPIGPTLLGEVWVSIKKIPIPDNPDRLKIIFEIIT